MLQGRRGPAATASEPTGLLLQQQQFGYPELNRAIPTPPPGNANKGGADDGDNSSYFFVDAEATAVGVVHRTQKRTLKRAAASISSSDDDSVGCKKMHAG